MPDNQMVEKVARAIAAESDSDCWEVYRREAIAAIAAMRQPTEAMQLSGHNRRIDQETGLTTLCGTDEIYTAMIDAALAPA